MDFALNWNAATFEADWAIDPVAKDIASDDGLASAVILSLFCDRRADPDDELPDGTDDRRAYWGDMPVDGGEVTDEDDLIGSKLWLLGRAKATPETAARAAGYILDATAWMIRDGIAADIQCTPQWIAADKLGIPLVISRYTSTGAIEDKTFDFVWNAALTA
ncbi:MAG: phage GP46 family protein [Janthinobacterium lividum]